MRLEHHLVGGYVRYISPHIIIIIISLYVVVILVQIIYASMSKQVSVRCRVSNENTCAAHAYMNKPMSIINQHINQ